MSVWINFQELRQKVTLEQVLFELYGIGTLKREGDKVTGPCPIHQGDSPRAFHADLSKNIWHCFTKCQRGGNQLDFVVAKEQLSIRDAGLRLHNFFLANERRLDPAKPIPVSAACVETPKTKPTREWTAVQAASALPRPTKNPRMKLELRLSPRHPHLESRGLKPKTIEHFDVGYCGKGILRGCIAIPIHNTDGELVAYAGRRLKEDAIREHGKYVLPKGFRKELELYNFHRAKSGIENDGLIIVESFFTVMKLFEAGFGNVVSIMGSELSDQQAELASQAKEVILLLDGDEAGRKGSDAARDKLKDRVIVRLIGLPEGAKPDELPIRAIRWAMNGARSLDFAEISFNLRRT